MFNYRNRLCLFLGLAIFVLIVGAFELRHLFSVVAQDKYTTTTDYGSQMIQYTKEGRYDDAVQTGLRALRNGPSDAGVYEQIVVVHLIRAQKDSTQRERWILQSISYVEKALSADPDNPVNVRDIAFDLEKAGDLSGQRSCQYYGRALDLSKRVAVLLESDHITAGGQTYPIDPAQKNFVADGHIFRIEPLQKANEKLSGNLKTKMMNAACR
jgi:hypothetical protein